MWGAFLKEDSLLENDFSKDYENAAECPVLWTGMNAAVLKFDRQDILVLHCIFAEAEKPRLSVKPRLVGGELHLVQKKSVESDFSWKKRGQPQTSKPKISLRPARV